MSNQSTGLSKEERTRLSGTHRASPTTLEPITVPVKEALRISGVGLTKFNELVNEGRVKVVRLGGLRLVDYSSLKALLTSTDAA
jgi:hypothetical protein